MNTDFDKLERRMPFSLEAEQSLLGSILIKPACLDELVAVIKADDFYLPEHSQIITAMQSMSSIVSPAVSSAS